MKKKIIVFAAAACLSAIGLVAEQDVTRESIEKLAMSQTFENEQFMEGIQTMASSFAMIHGKKDCSATIGSDLCNHTDFQRAKSEVVEGFSGAIIESGLSNKEVEEIISFFGSDTGRKWTVAMTSPSVIRSFEGIFSLVQKVIDDYPLAVKEADSTPLAEQCGKCKPRVALAAAVQSVKQSSFEREVLQSEIPVVVDFYADWCGPCRAMGPILEEVAAESAGSVKIVKVNVDQAREIAREYKVSGMPTFLFFKDGEVKERLVGKQTKQSMLNHIEKNL